MARVLAAEAGQSRSPGRRALAFLIAVAAASSAAVTVRFAAFGDYGADAKGSIDALSHGDLPEALTHPALMGIFSIILRAPFVAVSRLAGASELGRYQAGAFACLLAAGLLGVGLAFTRRSSLPPAMLAVVVVIAVVNPASTAAILLGHPEEALGAALCVGAVALASRDRVIPAAIALGLALATKQWAILAVVPALVATPKGSRLRLGAISGAIAVALTLPLMLANPEGFHQTSRNAATSGGVMVRTTWWFFFAEPERTKLHLGAGYPTELVVYRTPAWLEQLAHPLIVVVAVLGGALVYRFNRSRDVALPLLALFFLLRCTLDPVDNAYYHLPLLLAVLAWETLSARRSFPVATMLTALALWLTFDVLEPSAPWTTVGLVYAGWTGLLAVYLLRGLLRPPASEPATPESGYSGVSWRRLRSQTRTM